MEAGAEVALRLTDATEPATLVALLTHCAEAAEADEEFVAVRAFASGPRGRGAAGLRSCQPALPSSLLHATRSPVSAVAFGRGSATPADTHGC
jgi:hypothetical protein